MKEGDLGGRRRGSTAASGSSKGRSSRRTSTRRRSASSTRTRRCSRSTRSTAISRCNGCTCGSRSTAGRPCSSSGSTTRSPGSSRRRSSRCTPRPAWALLPDQGARGSRALASRLARDARRLGARLMLVRERDSAVAESRRSDPRLRRGRSLKAPAVAVATTAAGQCLASARHLRMTKEARSRHSAVTPFVLASGDGAARRRAPVSLRKL